MKIKYYDVLVKMNESQTTHISIPAWELPVIQAVHSDGLGGSGVEVVGEKIVSRELPSPDQEFARLANRYKNGKTADGSQGPRYVAMVYGEFAIGISKLAQVMQGSVAVPTGTIPAANLVQPTAGTEKVVATAGNELAQTIADVLPAKRKRATRAEMAARKAAAEASASDTESAGLV